jgi:replicative DNA helicase
MTTAVDRLPPQNTDAERSLLGSLLIDAEAITKIAGTIGPEDFYRQAHRSIYDAIATISTRNEKADYVTLCDQLVREGTLEDVGGEGYVAELTSAVPTPFHVEHYAAIVRRASILRQIIQGATRMVANAYDTDANPENVLDQAESLIFGIANEVLARDFEPIREILHDFNEELMKRVENKGAPTGVSTGIRGLDTLTGGLQRSDLVILAARPGVGKTAISLAVGLHAAKQNEVPVGFFALEMPSDQIVQRLVGAEARMDAMRIRDGNLDDEQLQRVVRAMAEIAEYPILIDDSPTLSVLELRGKARRMHLEHHTGLIVVDYLQLMTASGRRENRVQEITEITRSLKALARELKIPIIACAQLSRAVEQRPDSKPRLSDLRESGSIEQDADLVIFLHEPDRDDEMAIGRPVNLKLDIAKHRNGPTGTVDLRFIRPQGRFEEASGRAM